MLAANHRSYFDVAALALVAAKIGRPVRFLGKKEMFDAPVVGIVARAIGGIPVDRGSGSDQALRAAEAALRAGEVVIVLPQGTIPRGEAFFDTELHGKTGTARLAAADGRAGNPDRPVGYRGGMAALGPDARRDARPPSPEDHHSDRSTDPARDYATQWRTPRPSCRPFPNCSPKNRECVTSRRPPNWRAPNLLRDGAVRYRLALTTTRAVNATSRRLGRGQGTVAGGRAGLKVDPQLLRRLTAGRRVALISGTNGKTTTTRLLAVALGAHGDDVVSNETGSNMPPGHVAALVANRRAKRAVLEVDEIYLPRVLAATGADMVLLLNLSRDQLDRTNEVRMVANRWRAALAAAPHTAVIANADDPLVVWAAGAAAHVSWVGAGLSWHLDAAGCPSCEGRITFADDGTGEWHCESGCGFSRPPVTATLLLTDHGSTHHGVWADGRSYEIALNLPGRFNRANALMVAVAAETVGIDAGDALAAMGQIEEVAGRFATRVLGGVPTRLMLAKNPAGWSELLDLVAQDRGPARGQHQRADRRRGRPELAVGRALRTSGWPRRGGHW